jgi:dethiobiotin synthetase
VSRGIFIAGTDTEVGKTHVACRLLKQLRGEAINAVGMKPVASGMEIIEGRMANQDVEMIWQASDESLSRELINQYAYEPFIAPHLAAARQAEAISLDVIDRALAELEQSSDVVIIEGAGGLMTPINSDQTFLDLVQALDLVVVLVVAIRLGCINHALLTQNALQHAGVPFVAWVANYAEKTELNPEVIKTLQVSLDAPMLGILPWQGAGTEGKNLDLGSLNKLIGIQ